MALTDLRSWLSEVQRRGELKDISGVSCDLEMAGIAEILARESKRPIPALLFDDVPGYARGYRALFGMFATPSRIALTLGLDDEKTDRISLVNQWRTKRRSLPLTKPLEVKEGPVQENILSGEDIDLLKFPIPRHHELDGGRYLGTACAVITRDPDTGWVNVGTYRAMLVDRNRLAIHIQTGQQGAKMLERYMAKKEAMPIAIAVGVSPGLLMGSFTRIPWGVSEYDFAGGIIGEPVEVIKGPHTGLPIPANAEMIVEGECRPGELIDEGPFGEWHGYYANLGLEPVPEPIVRVKAILHRNDPILTCLQPAARLPHEYTTLVCLVQSGTVWDALESCSVPEVSGVWCHEVGGGSLLTVVSLRTAYAGHSKQAGVVASQIGQVYGRYVVVVDDDIDPTNLNQVMWAVCTRSDPATAIEVIGRLRSANSDPAIAPDEKRRTRILYGSRAIIDACRPYEWKEEAYPIVEISPELRAELLAKWEKLFAEFL